MSVADDRSILKADEWHIFTFAKNKDAWGLSGEGEEICHFSEY